MNKMQVICLILENKTLCLKIKKAEMPEPFDLPVYTGTNRLASAFLRLLCFLLSETFKFLLTVLVECAVFLTD